MIAEEAAKKEAERLALQKKFKAEAEAKLAMERVDQKIRDEHAKAAAMAAMKLE